MRELYQSRRFILTLLILFLLVWFTMLGMRTLVPTDEGRYAEMAREMVVTQDWITTRLNGIKYFEKPPLQTWMNAITFALFGLGEWQARLWTGLCGLFGIGLVAYTGRRVFSQRVGFYAPLVLASSLFWAGMGHVNTLDMGLAAMMTLSMCALLLAQRADASRDEQRNGMLLCWAGMALAVLSKGLIGIVLPGAALALYTLFSRDWTIWKRLHLVKGLILFLLITTPWFLLVSLKNPEFPQFFFIHEHVQRFTTKIHSRAGPWYYFIPILLLGILPWLGTLLPSLLGSLRDEQNRGGFQPRKMLLVWSVFIFVFFSMSGSKLPSYILPIFPALALLIADYLERTSGKAIVLSASIVAVSCAIAMAFIPRVPSLAKDAYSLPLVTAHVPWIYAAVIVAFVGAVLAIRYARGQKDLAMVWLAAGAFLSGQLLLLGHDPQGRYSAGIDHVPVLQAELTPKTPIYLVGRYEQALPFYLGRTMTLVGHADEMAFGLQQEPWLWLPTVDAFVARWVADHAAGRKDLAIMVPAIYRALQQRSVPMRLIGQDPRRVIVANDPESTDRSRKTER
ncbi:MAG: glycosyltransferase family 39 protein [Herbaspirillum sp.]